MLKFKASLTKFLRLPLFSLSKFISAGRHDGVSPRPACSSNNGERSRKALDIVAKMVGKDLNLSENYGCRSKKIEVCDGFKPVPFSQSTVIFEDDKDENISALELFGRTLAKLKTTGSNDTICYEAVECLLTYDSEKEAVALNRAFPCENEAKLNNLLTTHVFRPLLPRKTRCVVNKGAAHDRRCPCGCGGQVECLYQEIGDKSVWHGFPDVLTENPRVAISTEQPYHPIDLITGKDQEHQDFNIASMEEAKIISKQLSFQARSHAIASTVVTSFLATRELGLKNTLVPGILANEEGITAYFYDCQNDILLESCSALPWFEYKSGNRPVSMNMHTVTFLWMCLNYVQFGPYLSAKRIQSMEKSRFLLFAGDVLDVYKEKLKIGKLGPAIKKSAKRVKKENLKLLVDEHMISEEEFINLLENTEQIASSVK